MNQALASAYNLEKLNFLLVDDDKHMLKIVKSVLNGLGVKSIHLAGDAMEAMKVMDDFPIDIVILDYNMTPINGVTFARMVRDTSKSPSPFVPIIMLTAHTEFNRITEARDAGIHEYLAKPVSATNLYSRIATIIKNPRPFIRVGGDHSFFGPDRRRRSMLSYEGRERREPRVGTETVTDQVSKPPSNNYQQRNAQ
ncbi:response regulator [Magnetovibrio blakemorei]|uniref:Two-component system response regulator n=1 Tax=Magnetovibrio blakemorei TaxID=28181 RepID=A0A1E5Q2S2_9PROT|nr:response regulator [Magnetovibrio blakemorei]OEJ63675.1 two-component system response regulator [Magnetovibrio blakemorei]